MAEGIAESACRTGLLRARPVPGARPTASSTMSSRSGWRRC